MRQLVPAKNSTARAMTDVDERRAQVGLEHHEHARARAPSASARAVCRGREPRTAVDDEALMREDQQQLAELRRLEGENGKSIAALRAARRPADR
jgi:hypothetical protein